MIGNSGADIYEADEETQIETIGWLIHRRSEKGFIDSLAPSCPRDDIFLSNMKLHANKKQTSGSGDAELDSFNNLLGED